MFQARPSPHTLCVPPICRVALCPPCTLCGCTPHSRLPPATPPGPHTARPAPPHTACPACDPWQRATAFNQPLMSWDTSSVTNTDRMFAVRGSPRALPPTCSRAHTYFLHTLRAPHNCTPPRLPVRSSPRTVCPAYDPPQKATAFNQPLSWDTSSVTQMSYTFDVGCSPPPPLHPRLQSRPLPCTLRALPLARCGCTPQAPAPHLPPSAAYSSPRTARPAGDPWQGAAAFNQPLSWDTSGVTNMVAMFYVRRSPHRPSTI